MNHLSIQTILCLFVLSTLPIENTKAQTCYELIWSDEFNTNGLPDSTKWSYEVGKTGWGNNELQYYTNRRQENARIEDSVLIIEARKENYDNAQYTSARLITYSSGFSWTYGKIEARMKLPYGQGIWPAFWMLGDGIFEGIGWPSCGEIDIMELVGGGNGKDNVTHGTVHWSDAENNHAMYGGQYQLSSGIFNDEFHVFAIEWNETSIKWFLDGQQFHIVSITPSHMTEFHDDFFLILNLAVGGNWPGNPDNSTLFPQQLQVDYIRVYQRGETPSISGKKKVIKAEKNIEYSVLGLPGFSYNWVVPQGASIAEGQGTNSIKVNWGCNADTIKCELTTYCDTYTLAFTVGIDRFDIEGKNIVSAYEKDVSYFGQPSVSASYNWALPTGASIVGNSNSNAVRINWGSQGGKIKVNVNNVCGSEQDSMNVQVIKQEPYPDPNQPHKIPGIIPSVHYDTGGEGISYHDFESKNNGPGIRQNEGVDTESGIGSGNIGWTEPGEWIEYTIHPQLSTLYDAIIKVASINSEGKFTISLNGEQKTEAISVPSTNAWNSYTDLKIENLTIKQTDTILRIDIIKGLFNLGELSFMESTGNAIPYSRAKAPYIYPTPTQQKLYIKNLNSKTEFLITDVSGKTIKQGSLSTNDHIDVWNLTSGIYFLSLSNKLFRSSLIFIKQD